MSYYVISQIIGAIALVLTLIAYYKKSKKQIFKEMIFANCLDIIHYLLLGAYSGFLNKVVALVRNVVILKKEKNKKLNYSVYFVLFLIIYIILGIITYKNIYSTLPFLAAIIYMIVVWNGKPLQIKRIGFICYFLWLIYNIFIFSIVGIISNIISLVSTYIAYNSYKKQKIKGKKQKRY